MSAAFALEASAPPLAEKPKQDNLPRYGECIVCGAGFQFFADHAHPMPRTCGSRDCLMELLRRESPAQQPLLCRCPQRPFPHELSLHKLLRRESFNPRHRYKWPWSLCLSDQVEMSAEDR